MWLWIVATLAAFLVKGLCGFSNSLVFSSIMGFGSDNINISPVELVLGYPSNVILTWYNRKKLKLKIWLPLAILVIAGSIPGSFILKNVNVQYIKVFFGIVTTLMGIELLTRENGKISLKESKIIQLIVAVLAGIMCGIFGVGALLGAYIGRVTKTSDEFKANMSAVFIAENTFRIVVYSLLGIINSSSLMYTARLLPFMLIALFAGMKLSKMLKEKVVKKIVIWFLILSGIVLVVSNI